MEYEENGLSLRQIAAKKVHSRSTIQRNLKRTDVRLRAPGHGHGNPSQLRYGFRKVFGKVVQHKGEQQVIAAIKDLRAEGMTMRQIAQRMTVLKIPSKNGKLKWHPMMIKRIIGEE
jgi:transposase